MSLFQLFSSGLIIAQTSMVSQALFFRACMRKGLVDLGCTPYFIGPIPWLTYKEKEPIFLGLVTGSAFNNSVSIPTGKKSSGFSFNNPVNTTTKAPTLSSSGNCSKQYKGVEIDALSNALSDIEGNYDSVGAYVCDGLYCGRSLGTKQFIPAEQQATFESDITKLLEKASQQIDPTTGQPFTKKRLIERVAQMHFGGADIPIDAAASDVHGLFSVKDYGEKAAANYTQALQSMGCF